MASLRDLTRTAAFAAPEDDETPVYAPGPVGSGSQSDRALQQGMQNIRAQGVGLRALGNALIGRDEAATADALKSQAITEAAAAAGPRVQSFSKDVHGVGDLAEYARNTLLTQGPGLATTLAGGVAGIGARAVAKQGVKKAVSAAVANAAKTRAATAGASLASAGQTAGASAGENLTMEGEGGLRERALKTATLSLASGALDALPALRLLKQSGLLGAAKGEIQRQSGRLLTRIGKEAGKQALYEGFTETAQTALERSAQKWIDKRINLLAPEEFSRYLDSFAAGAVLGGGFGAGATALGARPSLSGKVREAIVNRRAKPLESAPSDSVADIATRNEALLKGANDDLDSLLDEDTLFDDDGDDFGVDFLGEATPGPEAAMSALDAAPPNIKRALQLATSAQAPVPARLRARLMVENWLSENDAPAPADAEPGMHERYAAAVFESKLPDDPRAVRAITQLARRPLRPDYDPNEPLATMVQGSRGLSDEDFAALRAYDETLSPQQRKAIADKIYGLSPNAPEEAARLRRMTAKGGGVQIDPRVFAKGLKGVGTKNFMSDRVLRSALLDVARQGDEAAITVLDELDAKVQAAAKQAPTPAARRERAGLLYRGLVKQLRASNPELALRVQQQLRDSYGGMSLDYAADTESHAETLPSAEIQAIDADGNEVLVNVPQQINYIRSVSGERAAGGPESLAFRQQLADAYGKLLEVLGGAQDGNAPAKIGNLKFKLGTALMDPRTMARDSLVLYTDPKTGSQVTLGHIRADGFFDTGVGIGSQPVSKEVSDKQETAGREAEGDMRVPGGDTFATDPRRAAEPQEDVIEAFMGAPVGEANARIERVPEDLADQRFQELEAGAEGVEGLLLKERGAAAEARADALAAQREAAAKRTPKPVAPARGASAQNILDREALSADKGGGANTALRDKHRGGVALKPKKKVWRPYKPAPSKEEAAPEPTKVVYKNEPREKTASADVRHKIRARREARRAALPKQERPDPHAGATGKNITNAKRKKRSDSAAAKAAERNAAELNAKLERDNAAAAAAQERARQPASDTQLRIMYNQLKNVTERGAAYVQGLVETAGGATLGQMFEIQTLATQLRRGAIDGAKFKAGVDRVFTKADDPFDLGEVRAKRAEEKAAAERERTKEEALAALNSLSTEDADTLMNDRTSSQIKSVLPPALRVQFREWAQEQRADGALSESDFAAENYGETESKFIDDVLDGNWDVAPNLRTMAENIRKFGTAFPKPKADDADVASKGFKAWLKSRVKGKRPSAAQLQKLANAALEWLGVDATVTVRYAEDNEPVSIGQARPKADGTYEIVLADVQRGADLISTLAHEIGHVVKWRAYDKADAATQAALQKDFLEWMEENNNPMLRHAAILSSRGTAARQQQLAEWGKPGKTLAEMTPEQRQYVLEFDEWFADQVARYLTTERAANTLVAKFFKAVARQFIQLAQAFGARAAPAASVKKFLDGMSADPVVRKQTEMEAAITAAIQRDKLPRNVTAEEAAAATNNFTQPGSQDSVYSIIETFRRLPASTQNVLRRVVRRENVLALLRSKVQDKQILRAMDNPSIGDETRMAVAFELWRAGELKLAEIQGPFRKVWDGFLKTLGLMTKSDYFEQFLVDMQSGKAPRGVQNYSVFKRSTKGASAAAKSFAALDQYYRDTIVPAAQKIFSTGVGERMMNSGIPAMVDFALKMKVPTGARQQTEVGLFQARMRTANALNARFGAAIQGMDEEELAEINAVLQQAAPLSSLNAEQKKAYETIRKHFDATLEYLQQAGVKVEKRKNYYPIVMLEPDQLAQKKDEFIKFFAENFAPQMRAKLLTVLGGRYYDGMTAKAKAKVDADRAELTKQLEKRSPESLAQSFYAMAIGEDPGAAVQWEQGARPSFRYMNEQLMDFVLDARPELRAKFGEFREQNLSYVVARYNEAAAKRAEFQRRFPEDADVAKYFDDAEAQGAKPEHLALMHDYLDVMMGNYGLQYPAALKNILGGVDKMLGTKLADNPATARKIQGFITVYQNLRLLGLATLSSLVDGLGISVRSGKTADAWAAYRDTFKSIRKKGGMEAMWNLAEDLGVVETSATNEALAMAYGGLHLSRGARKINDFFFQAIGLTRWTQATRVAALAMGERFLLRHKDGTGKHSARYLDELGLKPSDIVEKDGHVVMNDKVRDALLQFVDEAILRPDPSQRPLWMSDPNYMLLSQYKSFTYAFQNTILKRIGTEFREGNYQPLLTALAYVPLMLGAELLRELIQHGPEGDPRREDWGAAEYGWHATQRTGMLGPREYVLDAASDPAFGNLPGVSFLGPSVSQARSLAGDKATSTKVQEALPASSVWKHHVPKGEAVEPLETE